MGNRAEVSLSNPSLYSDVTAWRAIRNAERNVVQQKPQLTYSQTNSDYQISRIPVTIFRPEKSQATQPTTNRITELNGQLSVLRQQKKRGEIAPSYYRIRQKELANELHAEMRQRGNKPIRTKSSI